MTRNMQSYYALQNSQDLRMLLSRKRGELQRIKNRASWFLQGDQNRLQRQIEWIEIELRYRDEQMPLFE